MSHKTASKTRKIADAVVLVSATATAYPTFPDGSVSPVVFAGDMRGAEINGFVWDMTALTGFTAADAKIQHSQDGVSWQDYVTFTQKTATGSAAVMLDETNNDELMRYVRVEIDMTGTPGSSTHTVSVLFDQCGPRGELAPPGLVDRC